MTAVAYRTPPNAPADERLYLTALVLVECDQGVIERDSGQLWAIDSRRKVRYAVALEVIDELERLGWVSLADGHDAVSVTDKGRYWLRRFARLNGR
jgi:hypothetical protein